MSADCASPNPAVSNTMKNTLTPELPAIPPLPPATGSAWTSWPTHTGQQFVALGKELWVGSVDVGYTDAEHGTKLTIWKGGAIYTVWSAHQHGFQFQQIAWPSMPNVKLCEEGGK